jgi:acyl-CoA synthetase (NDP forming)
MHTEFADLSLLVNPRSVVVVGASDRADSVGGRTLANLLDVSGFSGGVYLVNRTRETIRGMRCYKTIADLPDAPDLAIVAVPAEAVLEVLEDAADKGVKFAICFTSGFSETGSDGQRAEAKMREIARRSGMRIYGPNCPGLNNINSRLGFTFSPAFKLDLNPGPIGLATQGGGLGRSFLQAMERGLGVGLWASGGNEADLEVSDFIYYMAEAPDIKVIATLIEGFRDGEKFIRAIQHAARNGKPVVALKVGKSDYGVKAAQSHTAAIAGSADINRAVLRQLGVIEVDDVDELIDTSALLARRLPTGDDKLAVYCSSGGAAALAADMIGDAGLELATFSAETIASLKNLLPDYANIENPVDTTTSILTDPEVVDKTLQVVVDDPGVSLVLYPTPLEYGLVTLQGAESAIRVQAKTEKVILPVWMSDRLGDGYKAWVRAGMMPARVLGKAVKAARRWVEYGVWRKTYDPAYEPLLLRQNYALQVSSVPYAMRTLSEFDAKALLCRHGLPVLRSGLARCREEAIALANDMGYPVVAKIASADITHKSDVGGVAIGLQDASAVSDAWDRIMSSLRDVRPGAAIDGLLLEQMAKPGGIEVLVGVHRDDVFGPMITFGLGGIYVEILKDVARRLLPLNRIQAQQMIREIRSYSLLEGIRAQQPADVDALVDLLLRVSDFVSEAPDIQEVELNPVWVGPQGQGAIPLDAVIIKSVEIMNEETKRSEIWQ